ncbi:MAG: MotA/TolQ/ExbB proton channel family protein [Deltaproteobacteria bacterium]|nr:MotA/TolQ/ExbB proton channel family protein [Deltaproteobacteria bacterium]
MSLLADTVNQAVDFFGSGGGVMYPLLLVSLVLWILITRKSKELVTSRREERGVAECLASLARNELIGAEWQQAVMRNFLRLGRQGCGDDLKLMDQLTKGIGTKVDGSVKAILVLAGVAPLLGLLGTVSGMITTFDVIAGFGTGNARAMASGISEALVTTQTGLVVAVPGLIIGNLLRRRVEGVKNRMDLFVRALVTARREDRLSEIIRKE